MKYEFIFAIHEKRREELVYIASMKSECKARTIPLNNMVCFYA